MPLIREKIILVEQLSAYLIFLLKVNNKENTMIVFQNCSSSSKKLLKFFGLSAISLMQSGSTVPVSFSVFNRSIADISDKIFQKHEATCLSILNSLSIDFLGGMRKDEAIIIIKKYLTSVLSENKAILEFFLAHKHHGTDISVYSRTVSCLLPYMSAPNLSETKIKNQRCSLVKFFSTILAHKGRLNSIVKNLVFNYRGEKNKNLEKLTEKINDTRPLYFPHKGVSYGDLFDKDLYYFCEQGSANYLHVEVESEIDEFTKKSYQDKGIKYEQVGEEKLTKKDIAHIIKNFISHKKVSMRMKGVFFRLDFLLRSKGRKYVEFVKRKKKHAGLAILGYPELFDPFFAAILQKNNFFVLGFQERIGLSAFRDYGFMILDMYICEGNFTHKNLKKNNSSRIESIVVMRPYRVDWIQQKKSDGSIVCFDFHTDNEILNNWSPVVSVRNNRVFYKDILYLARTFPDNQFIIKSKDKSWLQMSCYEDIRLEIKKLNNVSVVGANEEKNAYQLMSKAKLVLGKHTSALDEAMLSGKNVLIHDYGINYSGLFKSILSDFHRSESFACSRSELFRKVGMCLTKENRVSDTYPIEKTKEKVRKLLVELLHLKIKE